MNHKEYVVKVYDDGAKFWYQNKQLHREDGPACEWADGSKGWYLNGESFSSKEDWEKEVKRLQKTKEVSYENKVVEIGEKKYRLILI